VRITLAEAFHKLHKTLDKIEIEQLKLNNEKANAQNAGKENQEELDQK